MRAWLLLPAIVALAACTDTSGGAPEPTGGPQVAETVDVTHDATVYSVSFVPATGDFAGPTVAVERVGGRFMAGDREKALIVAQKYCDGTGRMPVPGAAMSAARVEGKWEFMNLCR